MNLRPYEIPEHRGSRLSNGAELFAFDCPGSRFAEVRIAIPLTRHSDEDAALSALFGALTLNTIDSRQAAIRNQLLAAGAEFSVVSMPDRFLISGLARADRLVECVRLVLGALSLEPMNQALELARAVESTRTENISRLAGPKLRSVLNLRRWGDHPFRREVADPAHLAQVDVARYKRFLIERVGAKGTQVIVVTDFSSPWSSLTDDQLFTLGDVLGRWSPQSHSDQIPALQQSFPGGRHLVVNAESPMVKMHYMSSAPPRSHIDHTAFRLASVILGGYSGSRLVKELRDRDGSVYQAMSGTEDLRGASTHSIHIECAAGLSMTVEGRFAESIERFCNDGPTKDEFEAAARYAVASNHVRLGPTSAFASAASGLLMSGGSLEYWKTTATRTATLTASDVRDAARRYLDLDRSLLGIAQPE